MSDSRSPIHYILTDIEGTTSDIAFVHQTLFPYAAEHLPSFIRENASRPEVAEQLSEAARVSGLTVGDQEAIIEQLLTWIREDQKVTPLKNLQGQVWRHGYQAQHFRGHLYDDAHQGLLRWSASGLTLGIYSSGSVEAQKLLFGYSDYGDLTALFNDHFDTRVGHKRQAESYTQIAQELTKSQRINAPSEVLFLSDVVAELDAARTAGMQTCELRRDDAAPSQGHPSASGFDEVSDLFSLTD